MYYRRVDFRELVRDLFALYKTRIWMQQIDASFQPSEWASRALATGNYTSPQSEATSTYQKDSQSQASSTRSRASSVSDMSEAEVLTRLSHIWS